VSRDKPGGIGSEEDRRTGELLRLAEAAHWRPHQQLTPAISAIQQAFVERGSKLIADGKADQPIIFTSGKAAGSRAQGDWEALFC